MKSKNELDRLMDLAIAALEADIKKRRLRYEPPKNADYRRRRRLETDPNGLAHDEYCEDMKAIADETGTSWGGNFRDSF